LFKKEIELGLRNVKVEWVTPELNDGDTGITAVEITRFHNTTTII
jgi:hypothetical protein